MPVRPDPEVHSSKPSNFASRRAEREAREAVEGPPPEATRQGFRAGFDAETPSLVITRVSR